MKKLSEILRVNLSVNLIACFGSAEFASYATSTDPSFSNHLVHSIRTIGMEIIYSTSNVGKYSLTPDRITPSPPTKYAKIDSFSGILL